MISSASGVDQWLLPCLAAEQMQPSKTIIGLWLVSLLAELIPTEAQSSAPGDQPGGNPVTNSASAGVAPAASSEIPQKTTSVHATPPPPWQDIAALPQFSKSTSAQRKHVFDKWLQQAAESGDSNARFELVIEERAKAGDAVAQSILGTALVEGQMLPKTLFLKDQEEGVKWWIKSANQGNVEAQKNLGWAYRTGTGVTEDQVEGVKWCSRAAEQGDGDAQTTLGIIYAGGKSVPKDASRSFYWFSKACQQGGAVAEMNVGCAYFYGQDGVEKNQVEGARWLLKAANQGLPTAQYYVALAYYYGKGVVRDEVEGYAWSLLAAAQGTTEEGTFRDLLQTQLERPLQIAGEQRAKELQVQIASHTASANNDSTAAISLPALAPDVPKASGSGAFISVGGLVLTAAHVVQGASRIEVVTAAGKLAATVVKIDATNDVALLKCAGGDFTPLPIAPSKGARAGTSVFTVGFPNIQIQGFDPKLTKGEISSQTGFQDDPRQWQISVPIQPGNSGGPLCDENGNLIGMVEATLDALSMAKVEGEIPQNVNYAVKSSYILPLLDDVQNLPPPLGPTNGAKFEDVVGKVQKSVVLILVY